MLKSTGEAAGGMDYSVLEIRVLGVPSDRVSATAVVVGAVLDNHIRSDDVLLRFHNGRFVVILVDVPPQGARRIADRLGLVLEALKVTVTAPDPFDFSVEISDFQRPEDSDVPSVQAAIMDAMSRHGAG